MIIITALRSAAAGPNPILDNESDESLETKNYRYPDLLNSPLPYWRAYPLETKLKLKEHDHLEIDVLRHTRRLDFKLREAWTKSDKPFIASH